MLSKGALLRHPGLLALDLAAMADSEDPRVRGLAMLDPDLPAAVVERLSVDDDWLVRLRAAGDARLAPERLAALYTQALADRNTILLTYLVSNRSMPVPMLTRAVEDAERLISTGGGSR